MSRALSEITPVVKPAQPLQAVVIDLARHVIQRITQKMHVAALPGRLREHFTDRRLQPLKIVGDDKLDAEYQVYRPIEFLQPSRGGSLCRSRGPILVQKSKFSCKSQFRRKAFLLGDRASVNDVGPGCSRSDPRC